MKDTLADSIKTLKATMSGPWSIDYFTDIQTTVCDFDYYLEKTQKEVSKEGLQEKVAFFDGKSFKDYLVSKGNEIPDTLTDDEKFYYFKDGTSSKNIRRNLENAVIRADSYTDKVLRKLNGLAEYHLADKDVKLVVLGRSLKILFFPHYRKIIEIFQNKDFQRIRSLRNAYVHYSNPDIEIKEGADAELELFIGKKNKFLKQDTESFKEILELLNRVLDYMEEINLLLACGIMSEREKKPVKAANSK